MNIAKLIKSRRIELGMTQADLAKASGASQSLLSKIEAGNLHPRFDDAVNILKALKLKVEIK
jgi:predicted transcriptional regulator